MPLSKQQIQSLLGLIGTVQSQDVSCDDCFGQIGQFAENVLSKREIPESMRLIDQHLQQCPCCKDEFEALLIALQNINEPA